MKLSGNQLYDIFIFDIVFGIVIYCFYKKCRGEMILPCKLSHEKNKIEIKIVNTDFDDLNTIKKKLLQYSNVYYDKNQKNECCICTESLKNNELVIINCLHIYHSKCLFENIKINK